ncbi:MAG: class I SAM-dependent methyltransferase [Chroococcidiopsidaceae cyanobacterium CP_BM_RX_35]|nr:class I SAM-dependent methyltransferase [Chroococcidiopsidaceae cyanobacterium CP_BM_RX_35]
MTEHGNSLYLNQVRRYYDEVTPLYLKYMGTTYQAGLIASNMEDTDPYRATNLYFASRAGIQPGQHILDAGCGTTGPSIDIVQNIERVRVDAITLSPVQAHTAKELIQRAGLFNQIRVHVGDFHYLPFANGTFDIVFFFESVGYSYDLYNLFAEVYRVLRPGGSMYIKGIFSKELPLSKQEQQELEEFNQIYAHKTPLMSITTQIITTVGFKHLVSCDLTEILSTREYRKAMVEFNQGFPTLTELGKYHRDMLPEKHNDTPIYRFGEIKAWKPS